MSIVDRKQNLRLKQPRKKKLYIQVPSPTFTNKYDVKNDRKIVKKMNLILKYFYELPFIPSQI